MAGQKTVLIISDRSDNHTKFVARLLERTSFPFFIFDTADFPNKVRLSTRIGQSGIEGHIDHLSDRIDLESLVGVWYRRPRPYAFSLGMNSEAGRLAFSESRAIMVGLWESINALWVNKPSAIHIAQNKVLQLRLASEIGFRIPATCITNEPQVALDFYISMGKKIVIKQAGKPFTTRVGDKYAGFFTHRIRNDDVRKFEEVKHAPCFFQEYVDKKYDLRVTVVGSKVFAAKIESKKTDWREEKKLSEVPHEIFELPSDMEQKCLALLRRLNLKFGAIDLAMTRSNEFVFFEINPGGQWLWIQQMTGLPIGEALVDLLISGERAS